MVTPKIGIKKKRPSFFTVIIPGYSTQHLSIPPPFLELISNDLYDEATLNSNTCSEWSWNVGVTETTGNVYFKDGWQEFLKDNNVEDGDFVVFEYEGNMNFKVQIFDSSCCERDCFCNSGTPKISSFAELKKRHPGTARKLNIGCSKSHFPLNSRKDYSDNIAKQRLPAGRPRKSHISCSTRRPCPSNSSKGSAEPFKSNNPHVTLAIKKTFCVYSFPTSFYTEHLSAGNYKFLFLKIAEGEKWFKVKLVRSIATAFISKGWSKFARANQIKVGNVCTFEVVEENKLVVHIIH